MRLLSLLLFGVLFVHPTFAAEFPTFEKLKPNPDYPNPLIALDGSEIKTAEDWKAKRRPELKNLFQHYMYGQYPAAKATVSAKLLHEDTQAFDGKGILREYEVSVGIKDCPPFYMLLAMPKPKPNVRVPVFVGLNFSGNHTLIADEKVRIPTNWQYDRYPGVKMNKATDEGRGKSSHVWPLEQIVEAGYAVATVYSGDFDPDRKEVREGMRPFVTPKPKGVLPGDFTSTIMMWSWGIHRMVDAVQAIPEIDPKRIAAVGHSRLGKTVLLATAMDDRIAVAFPHQAGCGGTAPSRQANPKVESVKRINTSFPHWFCDNFKLFNDEPARLPFDQHSLATICAPRPVLYTNATEDEWANPTGQFEMLKLATPVYELLGVKGMESEKMPEVGKLVDSRLGYWIRAGKHEMNRDDWKIFVQYANKWMK